MSLDLVKKDGTNPFKEYGLDGARARIGSVILAMTILGMGIWSFVIVLGIIGIVLTWMKVPKSKGTRRTIKTLSVLGLVVGIFFLFVVPAVNWQWVGGGPGPGYQGTFSVQISADNTAGDWDDTIVADVDLWAAGESDCNPVTMTCTVLVTATRVGTAVNTMAPDEALVTLEVARTDNNPKVDDADDFVNFWVTAPSNIPSWINTTNYDEFDILGADNNGRYYMYVDDEGGDAFWISPGETLSGAWMQPGDTETVRIGMKFNPVGFGADGQTADVSMKTLPWIVGGYTLIINVLDVAIS
jgi:hypothetical protein